LITPGRSRGGFGAKLCAANTGRFRRLYAGGGRLCAAFRAGRRRRSEVGADHGVGDSVTDGLTLPDGTPGSYRNDLWQLMKSDGYTVDFVAPGHPPRRRWQIPTMRDIRTGRSASWTPRSPACSARTNGCGAPRGGTDDIAGHSTAEQAVAELSTLVGHIVAARPAAEVFVATLIPSPSDVLDKQFVRFNKAVPGIVAGNGGHVHLVDMYPALSVADFADPLHPTGGGSRKWRSVVFGVARHTAEPF